MIGAKTRDSGPTPQELVETATSYVRSSFPGLRDPEDKGQQAYLELSKRIADGKPVDDPLAMIKAIAWRLANAEVTSRRSAVFKAAPVDPSSATVTDLRDDGDGAEDQLISAAERARARAVVQDLPPKLAAVYVAKYVEELPTQEALERLGLSESTYFHRLKQVHRRVHASLEGAAFTELQLKLYVALRDGRPSKLRIQALELQKADPVTAAKFRALEQAHQGLAATLPPSVLEASPDVSVVERVIDAAGRVRDQLGGHSADLAASQTGEQAATALTNSGAGRAAGAGAAGGLGAIGALGSKGVALICGGAAATAACVAVVAGPGIGPLGNDADRPVRPPGTTGAQEQPARPLELPPPNPDLAKPAAAIEPPRPTPSQDSQGANQDGGDSGGAQGEAPPEAPTPSSPSSPRDPTAYNPYNPTSPEPSGSASTTATSTSGGSSSSGGSDGGCNPYDPAC